MQRKPTLFALCLLAAVLPALAAETGSIRGFVRDAGGRPLAGAIIVNAASGIETESLGDGSFELTGMAPGSHVFEARLPGYTVDRHDAIAVVAGQATEVPFTLLPVATPLDEVVVTSTLSIMRDEPVSATALSRDQILDLPHFADDLYRAVTVLPGTNNGDISGRFGVRGGFHQEILVRLDGQELFEPFHLKDLQGLFSILDPEIVGGVDLIPSGFPAEFGDRMTSVLDMSTSTPGQRRTNLGISFSNAWFGSAGTFAGDQGHWQGSLRRGYLDVVLKLAEDSEDADDEDPSPRYWDAFGKLAYQLTPTQTLSLKVLTADDDLTFEELEDDGDFTEVTTGYGSTYLWLGHQALLGPTAFVDTIVSVSRVDGDRFAFFEDEPEFFDLTDDRVLDVVAVKQDWNLQPAERHYLKWGLEARDYEASYAYVNTLFQRFPIDDPRFLPADVSRAFSGDVSGEHYTAYLADRLRLGRRLTAEVGLRYDQQTLLDDDQLSPRLNLVVDLGSDSVLRAGWGRFYQSQRPHELDVQFGETEFSRAERADHWTLGYEKDFSRISLRADAYRRETDDPRPRYETVFDPFLPFPESAQDLVRLDPDSSLAQGLELHVASLGGSTSPRRGASEITWWASYALSSVEDEVDGARLDRAIDQTHALTASVNWRPSRKWNLNWVWTYHTGWPTTPVTAEVAVTGDDSLRIVHDVGPFYSERQGDYHRLDFRASRTSQLKKGRLSLFIDVQNLYNRENARGIDVDEENFHRRPDGSFGVTFPEETWLGVLPSFGLSWEI